MAQQLSDWVCICASGTAIDGRQIDKAWLKECAANYDRQKYTAMIWSYHTDDIESRNFEDNLGAVNALKYEESNGLGKLYAQLEPNEYFRRLNREGQKLFTSAEFWPDFAGTGQWYLSGISATDIPASLHTSRLQFTARQSKGVRSPFRDTAYSLTQHTHANMTPRERRLKRHHFFE